MLTITVKFNAAAPGNKTFNFLRTVLTDAGGAQRTVDKTAAQVASESVVQSDGSYSLAVAFPTVAVGAYTVQSQAYDAYGNPIGTPLNGSGTVSLADGVWYPQPFAFA